MVKPLRDTERQSWVLPSALLPAYEMTETSLFIPEHKVAFAILSSNEILLQRGQVVHSVRDGEMERTRACFGEVGGTQRELK